MCIIDGLNRIHIANKDIHCHSRCRGHGPDYLQLFPQKLCTCRGGGGGGGEGEEGGGGGGGGEGEGGRGRGKGEGGGGGGGGKGGGEGKEEGKELIEQKNNIHHIQLQYVETLG